MNYIQMVLFSSSRVCGCFELQSHASVCMGLFMVTDDVLFEVFEMKRFVRIGLRYIRWILYDLNGKIVKKNFLRMQPSIYRKHVLSGAAKLLKGKFTSQKTDVESFSGAWVIITKRSSSTVICLLFETLKTGSFRPNIPPKTRDWRVLVHRRALSTSDY